MENVFRRWDLWSNYFATNPHRLPVRLQSPIWSYDKVLKTLSDAWKEVCSTCPLHSRQGAPLSDAVHRVIQTAAVDNSYPEDWGLSAVWSFLRLGHFVGLSSPRCASCLTAVAFVRVVLSLCNTVLCLRERLNRGWLCYLELAMILLQVSPK